VNGDDPISTKITDKKTVTKIFLTLKITFPDIFLIPAEPPLEGLEDCPPGTVFDPANMECGSESGDCPKGEIGGRKWML